jgi:hypothetical protein
MTSCNRHPVDQLADIRTQIRELQAREDELRRQIRGGECGLVGDEYRARIRETTYERLDTRALRAHYGPDELLPFMRNVGVRVVTLNRRR